MRPTHHVTVRAPLVDGVEVPGEGFNEFTVRDGLPLQFLKVNAVQVVSWGDGIISAKLQYNQK